MVSSCRQPRHVVFMDPLKECVQLQCVHLVTLWNTGGKFKFCWKCSFSFQLLHVWELRAGRGVGSHAPEGLADSGSFCSKNFFQHLAGAKPVRLVQSRGSHHPKDWSHHKPPPTQDGWEQSVKGSQWPLVTPFYQQGRIPQSRPGIFSRQSVQWRRPPTHFLEVTNSRGLFPRPCWRWTQTFPGDIFNPKQTKLCLSWRCWQAPSLGNEGMWYLSRGNNKAPCLDTRTMSASEVLMIKARV